MIVFPAIDLKGGQVVRLAAGDMDRATVYGSDPATQALTFAEAGAQQRGFKVLFIILLNTRNDGIFRRVTHLQVIDQNIVGKIA